MQLSTGEGNNPLSVVHQARALHLRWKEAFGNENADQVQRVHKERPQKFPFTQDEVCQWNAVMVCKKVRQNN